MPSILPISKILSTYVLLVLSSVGMVLLCVDKPYCVNMSNCVGMSLKYFVTFEDITRV